MPMRLTTTRLMIAMLCAGVGSLAQAETHFYFVAQVDAAPPVWQFDHHRPDPNLPKHWVDMNAKERAELWPLLEPRMQRYYWSSMTRVERVAMREHLPHRYEYSIRNRYTSPADAPALDPKKHPSHRLSPEERARMRQQIREMHVEYYEFDRHRPRPPAGPRPPAHPAGSAGAPAPGMAPGGPVGAPPQPPQAMEPAPAPHPAQPVAPVPPAPALR